ncbi:hypothetical protein [Sphingobacterium multivorum]|uniref:hypothetical protein n=1 Tax=Sphingobacterium multivorum TaxID=28454 RepID=UPI0031B9D2D6
MKKSIYHDEESIMKATNGGLDIIRHYVPEIDECVKRKKKFSVGSLTPISTIKKRENGFYQISVFDNENYWMTAINLVQFIENEPFYNAIDIIITRHNIKL